MPVKVRLKLGAVVRLDDLDPEGKPTNDVIDEFDGCGLIAGVKNFKNSQAGTVIHRGELVEPLARPWNALQKLHVELYTVARLLFLVPLPTFRIPAMLLACW
jgi:hypothetical protein